MNVIFRADASPDIGGGHVMRCLTLADALIGQGWTCTFLSAPGSEDMIPALKEERYNLARAAIMDLSADVLVVDHYGLDRNFESDCRAWAKKIIVIDDLADRPHDCDLLMDQTLGRNPADYKPLVPATCRLLTGPDYALLRPQFAAARAKALARRGRQAGRVGRILIMLGTGDRDNVTGLVLAGLAMLNGKFVVDVVMGAGAPHLQAVRQQARESRHNVIVHAGVGDVAELMADADLCIGAGGTASWERCCMGLPTIVIEIADNQRKIIEELDKAGAIFKAGRHRDLTAEKIAGHAQSLIENPVRIVAMGVVASTICDGRGVGRLMPWFPSSVSTKDSGDVRLRLMETNDEDMVFNWQSQPSTRRYMRNPAVPLRKDHHAWMLSKCADPDCFPYIILYSEKPAGMLRLDRKNDCSTKGTCYEVSILIDSDYYKKGIASASLRVLREMYPAVVLQAEILPDNTASRSVFMKAGYQSVGNNTYINEGIFHP